MTASGIVRSLLTIFPIALPFYVFRSGIPQPAHYLLGLIVFVLAFDLRSLRIPFARRDPFLLLCAFIGYTIVVNAIVDMAHGRIEAIVASTYLIYNGVLFVAVALIVTRDRDGGIRALRIGVVATLVVQVVLFLVGLGTNSSRATMFFNNPNQLGYFGLLLGTVVLLLDRVERFATWQRVGLLCCAALLVAASLSRAAMVGFLLLITLDLLTSRALGRLLTIALIVLNVVVFATSDRIVEVGRDTTSLHQRVWGSMASVGMQSDDTLAARGYDRLAEHPQYLVFGAGSGFYDRFDSNGGEIHSTPASILFCYGIVGFLLFAAFVARVATHGDLIGAWLCIPILLYCVAHNGIRQAMLWVVFAVLIAGRAGSTPESESDHVEDPDAVLAAPPVSIR